MYKGLTRSRLPKQVGRGGGLDERGSSPSQSVFPSLRNISYASLYSSSSINMQSSPMINFLSQALAR